MSSAIAIPSATPPLQETMVSSAHGADSDSGDGDGPVAFEPSSG